jgi:alpha-L-rhamnosidase
VLALNFDMLPEVLRKQAAEYLVSNIKSYRTHLTTGFLGTPYLCDVLNRFGHTDVAYELLLQESYPSWLYPVKMGATTIWERWNGIRTDSTFEPASMNSFNHYAYGAIGDFMYRRIAGLETDGPGYKKIVIQPHTGKGLTMANASLQTYYGQLSSGWKIQNGQLLLDVEIPANTTAVVHIPAKNVNAVTESGKPLSQPTPVADGYMTVSIGSGLYHFVVQQ